MGITVIPAYRVVSMFIREMKKLPLDPGLDFPDEKLGGYVHHQLSMARVTQLDLGVQAAITQIGDPNPDALFNAIKELDHWWKRP